MIVALAASGAIVRGENDGGWKTSRPRWTATGRVAGRGARRRSPSPRGTPRWWRPGCARSAPAPRPTWSGGSARPRRPSAGRWPTSRPSRSPSTAAPRAGCCPTTSTRRRRPRPLGGAPARARPDHHGLEGARLPPRRARRQDLRPQRQRRPDRLVERPDRRGLVPARRRRGRGRPRREGAGGRAPRPRRRRPPSSPPGSTATWSARSTSRRWPASTWPRGPELHGLATTSRRAAMRC